MGRDNYRGTGSYPFKAGFNPQPKKVFRFKIEKLLGSLYLTRPLLERMQIKSTIDNIVPERKDNSPSPDKDGTAKFKVAERGALIDHPDRDKLEPLKETKPFWARCLIIWSKSRAKLEREKRNKYINDVKECLTDIALTKLNHRRYKDKDYAQNQVNNCFNGPKHYRRKVFGNPTVKDSGGRLELVYDLDEALLSAIEKRDGLYPVVTNVYDQKYSTEELFLRTRKKYSVEQLMRHLKSKIKIQPMFFAY